jgi:hypothetical protein
VDVCDENDRRIQQGRHFRGATVKIVGGHAIEKSHDSFDDRDIRILCRPREKLLHVLLAHHPGVEVVAGATRGNGQV